MKKLISVSLLLVLALGSCGVSPPAASPSPAAALPTQADRELSPEAAVARILDEYGMEDGLPISNCGEAPFAGRILSVSRLPSQTAAVVLYSMPADTDAEAFQFRLSEFISDDADLGTYHESIHLVFTVDRRSGKIERAG